MMMRLVLAIEFFPGITSICDCVKTSAWIKLKTDLVGRFRYWLPCDLLHPKEGFRDHLRSQVHRRPLVLVFTKHNNLDKITLILPNEA